MGLPQCDEHVMYGIASKDLLAHGLWYGYLHSINMVIARQLSVCISYSRSTILHRHAVFLLALSNRKTVTLGPVISFGVADRLQDQHQAARVIGRRETIDRVLKLAINGLKLMIKILKVVVKFT